MIKSYSPRYELGNKLSRHPVTVARIDATLYRSAAETYNVRGFPTIRLIGKDRALDFVGDRTAVCNLVCSLFQTQIQDNILNSNLILNPIFTFNEFRVWSSFQEALHDFAIKGSRPLLPRVGSLGKLRDLQKSDDVVFLSVGTPDDTRKCLTLVAPQTVHETIIAEVNLLYLVID